MIHLKELVKRIAVRLLMYCEFALIDPTQRINWALRILEDENQRVREDEGGEGISYFITVVDSRRKTELFDFGPERFPHCRRRTEEDW